MAGAGKRGLKGEATKAAILEAARERFAADGYDRVTIRGIAADAEIDPAMVIRYFGSKDKLFAAAARFDLRLPDLREVSRKTLGAAVVEHFLDRWETDDTLKALLRASVSNHQANARLRAIFETQLVSAFAPLFRSRATATTRAGLVVTQMLGLALTRYLLRMPPVLALNRTDIVTWLGPTIQRYLAPD